MRETRVQTIVEISRLPSLATAQDRGSEFPGAGRIRYPGRFTTTPTPEQLHADRACALGVNPTRNPAVCHEAGTQTAGRLSGRKLSRGNRPSWQLPHTTNGGRRSRP